MADIPVAAVRLATSTLDKRHREGNLKFSPPPQGSAPFSLAVAHAIGTGYDAPTVFAGVTRVMWPDAADRRFIESPLGFSLHTSKSAPHVAAVESLFD